MASIGSKRSSQSSDGNSSNVNSGGGGSVPIKKRPRMDLDFDAKFIASSQEDLDIGLLRVQNRRLTERLMIREKFETELRSRLEHMEKKQLNDDTKLYVINRYWNQLNEDMRLILQRFDSNAANDTNENNNRSSSINEDEDSTDGDIQESRNENAETTSFVRQLANIDKEELDEQLQQRVLLSTRAVSKVLQAFDRIVQRNEKVMSALKERTTEGDNDSTDDDDNIKSPDHDEDDEDDLDMNDSRQNKRKSKNKPKINLDETVRRLNEDLTKENKNLNLLVTSLHEKHHIMSLKYNQCMDKIEAKDVEMDELKNRIDELEFELNKSRTREQRLENNLYETREKLRGFQNQGQNSGGNGSTDNGGKQDSNSGISSAKIDDLKHELEDLREIAQSRLAELEQLNDEHKEALKLVEKYKMDLQCIPDSVIKDSAEYKSLQSHFSVLFNESMQLKAQVEEYRQQVLTAKNVHMRQIEQMEADELQMQKSARSELMQLEDSSAQIRKEYEMLRLEFEQTLAANEQTGPVNREMRHLITSLQTHIQQFKNEIGRMKKKLKESGVEIVRLKQIIEQNGLKVCCGGILCPGQKPLDNGSSSSNNTCTVDCCNNNQAAITQKSEMIKSELIQIASDSSNEGPLAIQIKTEDSSVVQIKDEDVKKEKDHKDSPPTSMVDGLESSSSVDCLSFSDDLAQAGIAASSSSRLHQQQSSTSGGSSSHRSRSSQADEIRELRLQLKKSWEAQRELRILLDMFKCVDKEKKDKIQIMMSEKKLRLEVEELKRQNCKILEEKRSGSVSSGGSDSRRYSMGKTSSLAEDEAKKIAKYEDIIKELQKNVHLQKQQEEALLKEMEVTGQAFEDMQEQNCRLIQQLREKDDANFKLMSERIKSNQIHKLLNEEKDSLTEQIVSVRQQIEHQNQVVRKLEESERILQQTLSAREKDLLLRQQAADFYKRKAMESTQSAADLKLHLEKYVAQIKDAQSIVADKTSAWQQETFKTKRLQDEVLLLKRKYERAKKFELAATAEEVLQEELRELREELTCPSCKTKRKDAVLNKCFHVFCYDCLKTRYETRQRKCPKCNQSFSSNDFHRLYLA